MKKILGTGALLKKLVVTELAKKFSALCGPEE